MSDKPKVRAWLLILFAAAASAGLVSWLNHRIEQAAGYPQPEFIGPAIPPTIRWLPRDPASPLPVKPQKTNTVDAEPPKIGITSGYFADDPAVRAQAFRDLIAHRDAVVQRALLEELVEQQRQGARDAPDPMVVYVPQERVVYVPAPQPTPDPTKERLRELLAQVERSRCYNVTSSNGVFTRICPE